jgi:hypothetical protein
MRLWKAKLNPFKKGLRIEKFQLSGLLFWALVIGFFSVLLFQTLSQNTAQTELHSSENWKEGGKFANFKPENEILELRDETGKHFRNADGTITAVLTAGPVHYQEDGKWKELITDIDNNTSGLHPEYAFATVQNQIRRFYPEYSSRQGILMDFKGKTYLDWLNPEMRLLGKDNQILSRTPAETSKGSLNQNQVTYPNVYPESDVMFEQIEETRKMEVIIKSPAVLERFPAGSNELAYCEDAVLPEAWTYEMVNNNENKISEILIKNENGEVKTRFLQPYIYEQNHRENESTGYYSIEKTSKGVNICKVFQAEWLKKADRQFPVIADPTLSADTSWYTGTMGGTSYTKWNSDLDVGCWGGPCPASVEYRRGWARFNTSAVMDGSTVSALSFTSYNYGAPAITQVVYLYPITNDPLTATGATLYNDLGDGTIYGSYTVPAASTGSRTSTFGSSGYTGLANSLTNNWFAIGFTPNPNTDQNLTRWYQYGNASRPYITFTYAQPSSRTVQTQNGASLLWVAPGTSVTLTTTGNVGSGGPTCIVYWYTGSLYSSLTTDLAPDCDGAVTTPAGYTDGAYYNFCVRPYDSILGAQYGYFCTGANLVRYDAAVPSQPVVSCPGFTSGVWGTGSAPTCTWTDPGSGPSPVTYYYCTNGCTDPSAGGLTSPTRTTPAMGEGTYSIRAETCDTAGCSTPSSFFTLMRDSTAPTQTSAISINSGAAYTNSTTLSLLFNATDNASGYYRYRLSCDNITWTTFYSGLTGTSLNLATTSGCSTTDGTKTVYIQYGDYAGNWSGTLSNDSILLDTASPTLPTYSLSRSAYNQSNWSGTVFSGTASDPTPGSGVASVALQITDNVTGNSWNGTSWLAGAYVGATGTTSWTYSSASLPYTQLTSGRSYTVFARASDNAANTPSYTTVGTFTYDTVAPTSAVTIANTVYGQDWNYNNTINGTAADTGGSGVASVWVAIRNNSTNNFWTTATSSFSTTTPTYYQASGTTSWTYAFSLSYFTNATNYSVFSYSVDAAGNSQGTASQDSFTYDGLGPTAVVNIANTYYNSSNWSSTAIQGTASDTNGVSAVYLYIQDQATGYHWDGSNFVWNAGYPVQVPASGTASWSYNLPSGSLVDGRTYSVIAVAVDNLQNWGSNSAADTFTYDTTGPTVTLTDMSAVYGPNTWNAGTTSIRGSASASGSPLYQNFVAVLDTNTGLYWNGSNAFNQATQQNFQASGTSSWTYNMSGAYFTHGHSYTVTAWGWDEIYNTSATSTDSFTWDNTPPTFSSFTSVAGDTAAPYYDTSDNSSTYVVYTGTDLANCKWGTTQDTRTEYVAYTDKPYSCGSGSDCYLNLSGNSVKNVWFRCIDAYENATTADTQLTFTIDSVPPSVTDIYAVPSSPQYGNYVNFYVEASDATSGLNQTIGDGRLYLKKTGSGSWDVVNGAALYWDGSGGRYYTQPIQLYVHYGETFEARADIHDLAGNTGSRTEAPTELTVTNTPPPISYPTTPVNGGYRTSNGAAFDFETSPVTDVDTGQIVSYYFRVATGSDAETGVVCQSTGWQTSTTFSCNPGAAGVYYWHVYTSDGVNTTSPGYVYSFTNNYSPTNVSVNPNSNWYPAGSRTFVTQHSDPNGATNISTVYFYMNSSKFYAYYDRAANTCYMQNSGWQPAPQSNSWVTLNSCSSSINGNTLTVNWNVTIIAWNEGSISQYLYITDNYGAAAGWNALGTVGFDTTPPSAPQITTFSNPTPIGTGHYINASTVPLQFQANTAGSTDNLSGVASYQLCRTNDNIVGDTSSCSGAWVGGAHSNAYETVSGTNVPGEGAFRYYRWWSFDNAGNMSSTAGTGDFVTIDTTPPAAPTSLSLNSPTTSPNSVTTPIIAVNGVSNGDTVRLYSASNCTGLIGTATSAGTTAYVTAAPALSAGQYTFYANTTDPAGNPSSCSTNSVSYLLDTTAPSTPTLSYYDGLQTILTQTITFSASDAETGVDPYQISYSLYYRSSPLSAGNCTSWSGWSGSPLITTTGNSFLHTMSNLTCYQYYVTATNAAGLSSSSTMSPTAITKVQKPAPTVSSITPNNGPSGDGSYSVVITGADFDSSALVYIDNTLANNITWNNSGSITAATPSHVAGGPLNIDVKVVNPDAQQGLLEDAYTFWDDPTISSLSSTTGSVSNVIIINGDNFYDGGSFDTYSTNCERLTLLDSSTMECTTPASAGTVAISVTTPSGTSSTINYTGYLAPTITNVSPAGGPVAGGTSITVTGTNFVKDANVTLTFGGNIIPFANYSVNGPGTEITFSAPAHVAGTIDTVYSNPGGSAESLGTFTYYNLPTITSVSPNNGTTGGGTTVTVTGTNFIDAGASTFLTFGGINASSFSIVSPTQITATTPAHAAGAVNVVFTNPGGSGTRTSGFTYYTPTVTTVSPSVGPIIGGTSVTIIGSYFTGATSVTFGGASVSFSVSDASTITATTPAHAAGAVTVTVSNVTDSGSKSSGFTYYDPPAISTVSPSGGPITGGTSVSIAGDNFTGATSVAIGGTTTSILGNTGSIITVSSPAKAAGTYDVTVTTPGGTATKTSAFTYYNFPTITTVLPNAGPTAGGTSITVTGTNLIGTTSVTVGGTAAGNISVLNDTTLTATTPAKTAATYNVAVTTPGGTVTKTSAFTYVNPPTVSLIRPNKGKTAGGTLVTIEGHNFFFDGVTNTSVTIGGAPCDAVSLNSEAELTCETPPGTEGAPRDVVVTTPGNPGAFATLSGPNGYTYYGDPTITEVAPNKGPSDGGQLITITGTNFYNGETDASVSIGGIMAAVPCTIQSIIPTQITCTTTTVLGGQAGLPQDVMVTTATSSTTYNDGYTYYEAPTISNIVPNAGPAGVDNPITINGTNFYEIPGSALTVTVGGAGQNCIDIIIVSPVQITCRTPAGTAGPKTVEVTTPTSPAATSTYTFYDNPTVNYIQNYYGVVGGGNVITVYGNNFYTTTQYPLKVTVGGTTYVDNGAPDRISSVTANSFSLTMPAAGAPFNSQNEKIVDLSVTTGNTHNSNTLTNAYYYSYGTLPSVLDPTSDTSGLSQVRLTGDNGTGQYIDNITATPTDLIHTAGTSAPYLPPSLPYTYPVDAPYYSNFGPLQITNSYPATLGIPSMEKGGRYSITLTQPSAAPLQASVWIDSNRNNNFSDDGGPVLNNRTIPANSSVTDTFDVPVTAQTSLPTLYTRMRIGTNDAAVNPSGNGPSNIGEYEDYVVNIQPASAPTLVSVDPNKGPAAAGYDITINGTGFKPGIAVYFDALPPDLASKAATSVVWVDSNTLTAKIPALTPGSHLVYIKNLDNQSASLIDGYTAYAAPQVLNLGNTYFGTPEGGNTVSIFGNNFYSNSLIDIVARINGIACTITHFISNSELECQGVPGPVGGEQISDVEVETASGTSTPLPNAYYYNNYQLPIVSSTGGTVGISRTELYGEPDYDLSIDNTTDVTGSLSHSGVTPSLPHPTAYYTNYSPAQSRSTYDLLLGVPKLIRSHSYPMFLTGGGSSLQSYKVWLDINHDFDFNDAGEMIVAAGGCTLIPTSGSCAFNVIPPSNSQTGETRLRVGTDTGAVPANGNGPNNFGEYEDYAVEILGQATPTITNVDPPDSAPTPATTPVTITGTNFDEGATVKFGDTDVTAPVNVVSGTEITTTAPALPVGDYTITVTQADGTSGTSATALYHVIAAPTVISISPDQVPASTSENVTITGTNFYSNDQYPISVSIGGQACLTPPASLPVVTSETTLTCHYPSLADGTYDVSVTTGSGTDTATDLITYFDPPTITSIDPTFGSTIGGTFVTITGTNFYGTPIVRFDGILAMDVTVGAGTDTTITAHTPEHTAPGLVTVTVQTDSGTASLTDGFEYWPQPVDADASTVELFGNKIEPVDTAYYDYNNYSPVNAGLVKVTVLEQDSGHPALNRVVELSANPAGSVIFRGVDCSNPHHYQGTATALTDAIGTACFLVYNATSNIISATVKEGNFASDVLINQTQSISSGKYAETSILDFRFRHDDGNSLTATPIADTNVPLYNAVPNTPFRLRFGLTRNVPAGTDDQRFDEFSPTLSKDYGPGPLGGFLPADFKAFPGGYAINENTNTLYVITPYEEVTKARVYKFNLNNLSQAPASFDFPPTVNATRPYDDRIDAPITSTTHAVTKTFIDSDNNLMYFVLTPFASNDTDEVIRVYKVNLTTETVVDVLAEQLPSQLFQQKSYDAEIDLTNGFLYLTAGGHIEGSTALSPARVMKIKLNGPTQAMTKVGQLVLENTDQEITSSVIDLTNQFMYVTTGMPQKIIKIDLDVSPSLPPVKADEITLVPTPSDSPNEMVGYQSAVIDTVNGYAYFGSSTNFADPTFDGTQRAFITKVDIDPTRTLEVVSRLNLLPPNTNSDDYYNANYVYFPNLNDPLNHVFPAASIDSTNGYAYFPVSRLNEPRSLAINKIMRIHLSDFTRKSIRDELFYTEESSGLIKGTIFRPSTGRGYLIRSGTTGYEVLTEFNSTSKQDFALEVSFAPNNENCNNPEDNMAWQTLPTSNFVLSDSTYFTDGTPTTNVTGLLYDNNDSFVPGQLKDTAATTSTISLGKNQFTEVEYSIKPTTNAEGSYCFRILDADPNHHNQLSGYANWPLGLTDETADPVTHTTFIPVTINGVMLSKNSINVIEGTTTDTYGIKLATLPTSDVTININADDTRVKLSPDSTPLTPRETSLTFTPANWDTYQYITVSSDNNGTIDGTTTRLIRHTVASSDTAFDAIIAEPVQSVITDYGSSSSNVRATVSGDVSFTPPTNFAFPGVHIGTTQPNFSPAININFSDTRGPTSDYVLTVQAGDFCASPGICIPLDKVFSADANLINSFNTFTPAEIGQFISNYLQTGESLTDRSTFVHSNPSENRPLNVPITLIDTRNVPSGNNLNPLQGDLSFDLHLMIDFGNFDILGIGTYTTNLVFTFNSNP